MSEIAFVKMHGLGNDFVVIDGRARPPGLDTARRAAIAERRRGVGCDQLITIEAGTAGADAFMRIHNADGGEAGACGNAARCVAELLMVEGGRSRLVIDTVAGRLAAVRGADGVISVDMGPARLDWREIPLGEVRDTLHLGLTCGPLADPVAVSMGNPHAVFLVDDAEAVDLAALGPQVEHHPLFPERTNVGILEVRAPDRLRLRVWERGAGITPACGSAACAAVVAAHRRGVGARAARVQMDGGLLAVVWREDGHVVLSGPVALSFAGRVDPDALVAP